VLLIVPHVAPLHPAPERLQVTVPFVELCTVAVSWTDWVTYTLAVLGVSVTLTAAGGVVWSTPQAESNAKIEKTNIANINPLSRRALLIELIPRISLSSSPFSLLAAKNAY
jgi:hypothetical protein